MRHPIRARQGTWLNRLGLGLTLAIVPLAACGDDIEAKGSTAASQDASTAVDGDAEQPKIAGALIQFDAFSSEPNVSTLLGLLAADHAEVRARIGPHQIRYKAHFELKPERPSDIPPKVGEPVQTELDVDDELEFAWLGVVDGHPHASLRQQNNREDRRELVLLDGQAYTRLHEDQWYQRELDGDLHETWFGEAYACVHDFLEFAAPQLEISEPQDTEHEGRPAIALNFQRAASRDDSVGRDGGPSRWRASSRLDAVSGQVVIDRQSGVWLFAKVDIAWKMADKARRPLVGKSSIEASLRPGKVEITAPPDPLPMPERERLTLERDKLLDGLAAP